MENNSINLIGMRKNQLGMLEFENLLSENYLKKFLLLIE
jgi:hypothetical protein